MAGWSEGDVQANGINVHYYHSDGLLPPSILLLHGITDSGLCWPRVAYDLEARLLRAALEAALAKIERGEEAS
jgi:pimeloyl-ACP methyl ester carboxylesterase